MAVEKKRDEEAIRKKKRDDEALSTPKV